MNKRYSAIFAYSPSIGRDKVDFEMDKVSNLIKEFGGKVERTEYLGLKELAYSIKKYNTAHYVQYYFHLKDNLKVAISEINRKLGPLINQNTLRHMVTVLPNTDFNFESLQGFTGFDNALKV